MNADQKLDKLMEMVSDIRVVQAKHSLLHERNTEDLETHIKRTDLLEGEIKAAQDDIATLKLDKATLQGSWKTIGIIAAIVIALIKVAKDLGLL